MKQHEWRNWDRLPALSKYSYIYIYIYGLFKISFDGTTWHVIKLNIMTAVKNAVFFSIMRHKYISKRRNLISFRIHLCVVSHNSLHNELLCLRMLNLNQKAPRVFFSLFPHLSSSLFCSDPLGCVANSHLTQLHASSLTDCNSQPKAGHTIKRLYTGAQPNTHHSESVWTAIRVVISEV